MLANKIKSTPMWVVLVLLALAFAVIPVAGSAFTASPSELDGAHVAKQPAEVSAAQQQERDGFNSLAPGKRAMSMSVLVNSGLVNPQPVSPLPPYARPDPKQPSSVITWGPPMNMTQQPGGPNEPAAAVHPTNGLLALTGGNANPNTRINRTTNGGGSWQTQSPPNCSSYGDGVMSWFGANVNSGNSALFASLCPGGSGAAISSAKSTDQGLTWTTLGNQPTINGFFNDREYLWTDHFPSSPYFGRMYLSMTLFDPGASGSYNAVAERFTTDEGATWSTPSVQDIAPISTNGNKQFLSLAIQPSGAVVAMWQRAACCGGFPSLYPGPNQYKWARSTDGGVTFAVSGTIATDTIARQVPFNSTSPGGFRWNAQPGIAADPVDGTLYGVWLANRADNTPAGTAVFISKSTNNGSTWSTPSIVYNNPNPNLFQYMPWVDVSTDHAVHVTYSGGVASNTNLAHFYVQSTDAGVTWTAPFQLSSATYSPAGFMGDYQAISIGGYSGGGGSILATWTDVSAGENQWGRMGTFVLTTPTPTFTYTPTRTPTRTPTVTPTCTPNYALTFSSGFVTAGSLDIGNHCDDCTTLVTLPFVWRLYNQPFSSVRLSSNGTLQFSSNNAAYFNTCLPNAGFNNTIFAFWDDLRTDTPGSGIYTRVSGVAPNRVFSMEWFTTFYANSAARAHFGVRLFETSNVFDITYGNVEGGGISATIGVQRGTGNPFTQYSCNVTSIRCGLRLIYTPTLGCPTLTPTSTRTPTRTNTPILSTAVATVIATAIVDETVYPIITPIAEEESHDVAAYLDPAGVLDVPLGEPFTIDLRVSGVTTKIMSHQSYLNFDPEVLQVVNPDSRDCRPADTITPDTSVFNDVTQNEVCNGPERCEFHSGTANPGTISFASSARGSEVGDFLVAQITFCAIKEDKTTITWAFDERERSSAVFDPKGELVSDPNLYKEYTINSQP